MKEIKDIRRMTNQEIRKGKIYQLIDDFNLKYKSLNLSIGGLNFDKLNSLVVYKEEGNKHLPAFYLTPDKIFSFVFLTLIPANVILELYQIYMQYEIYVTRKNKG